jgi:hypothetical protein
MDVYKFRSFPLKYPTQLPNPSQVLEGIDSIIEINRIEFMIFNPISKRFGTTYYDLKFLVKTC